MNFFRNTIFSIIFLMPVLTYSGDMTPKKMIRLINKKCDSVSKSENVVKFKFEGTDLTLVYDVSADRMRIISPVKKSEDLLVSQLEKAMMANFHSTLDTRYCISQGFLWAAFIHPLKELSDELLISAIEQVTAAAKTFGSTYSSGKLNFGG